MPIRILVAPAGQGKTEYVLQQARRAALDLQHTPWVILARDAQVRAFRERLASQGGALGVQVMDFAGLYHHLCFLQGSSCEALAEPVRFRLLCIIIDQLCENDQLLHYVTLRQRPGFAQLLGALIQEFKQSLVTPDDLAQALQTYGEAGSRLNELVSIYRIYEKWLQEHNWHDPASIGQLALQAVDELANSDRIAAPILVDGFDHLNSIQIALLVALAHHSHDLTITLTGDLQYPYRAVFKHVNETRLRLEQALGVTAESLDSPVPNVHSTLQNVALSLYVPDELRKIDATGITLLETPSKSSQVREVLRWCKERLVHEHLQPSRIAILAQETAPYHAHLLQVAREFGLPLQLASYRPLAGNALIASLLDLLTLLRHTAAGQERRLDRRLVIESWQSPYLDWERALGVDKAITAKDAQQLDQVARANLVIQGEAQWREALQRAMQQDIVQDEHDIDEEDQPHVIHAAEHLGDQFEAFLTFLQPPQSGSYRDYVRWLEQILGFADAKLPSEPSLAIASKLDRDEAWGRNDYAALRAFHQALLGLVWTEMQLGLDETLSFEDFDDELVGVIQATRFMRPQPEDAQGILVADLAEARGLRFHALAIMGLSEGEFPPILRDDPLLRDADRRYLQSQGLSIDPKLEGDEHGRFYEAVTRASQRLLLTRSFMDDSGQDQPASAHWQEMLRVLQIEPQRLFGEPMLAPAQIASESEWGKWWVRKQGDPTAIAPTPELAQVTLEVAAGAETLLVRQQAKPVGPLDGDLSSWERELAELLGPTHIWSASRLEAYRACPFRFFVSSVLGLDPRIVPAQGLDAAQKGSVLHHLMEELYAQAPDNPSQDDLLALLPHVAQRVLGSAPQRFGFRATPWWQATCIEIEQLIEDNIEALCAPEFAEDWTPLHFEVAFGLTRAGDQGSPPLIIDDGQGGIRVRGLIDRIDRDHRGQIRIIDYKSARRGGDYVTRALEEGKKLQLSLYGLAARDALKLGEPVEGLYWHLGSAQPSSVTLAKIGAERAFELVRTHVLEAVVGARSGHFEPSPPSAGCPSWCPAASICWRYLGSNR